MCYVTLAEVRAFLALRVLAAERSAALEAGLADYSVLPTNVDQVAAEWVRFRAATARLGTPDDRERRQNDTWIAACASSISPPLPVVTANLGDFTPLAGAGGLALVHPDL